jgi:hypothetical protein
MVKTLNHDMTLGQSRVSQPKEAGWQPPRIERSQDPLGQPGHPCLPRELMAAEQIQQALGPIMGWHMHLHCLIPGGTLTPYKKRLKETDGIRSTAVLYI